jgi:integral membrane sensor domain MASE1
MQATFETLKNILAVIGGGCVLSALVLAFFGTLFWFRK